MKNQLWGLAIHGGVPAPLSGKGCPPQDTQLAALLSPWCPATLQATPAATWGRGTTGLFSHSQSLPPQTGGSRSSRWPCSLCPGWREGRETEASRLVGGTLDLPACTPPTTISPRRPRAVAPGPVTSRPHTGCRAPPAPPPPVWDPCPDRCVPVSTALLGRVADRSPACDGWRRSASTLCVHVPAHHSNWIFFIIFKSCLYIKANYSP